MSLKDTLTRIRDEAQQALDNLNTEERAEEAREHAQNIGEEAKAGLNQTGDRLQDLLIDLRKKIDPNYSQLDAVKDKVTS